MRGVKKQSPLIVGVLCALGITIGGAVVFWPFWIFYHFLAHSPESNLQDLRRNLRNAIDPNVMQKWGIEMIDGYPNTEDRDGNCAVPN